MDQSRREMEKSELKHLGFVRVAALNTLAWLSNLYDCAKHNSGPLKPVVDTVEGAVTAAVAPVYHKFKAFPTQLVSFLDHKVEEATVKLEEHTPAMAKQVGNHLQWMINKVTDVADELFHQARVGGMSAATHYAASESKELVAKMWTNLDRLPSFHAMAHCCSHRYNHAVTCMTAKGYTVFGYLPLIPVESIVKAFKQAESNPVMAKAD